MRTTALLPHLGSLLGCFSQATARRCHGLSTSTACGLAETAESLGRSSRSQYLPPLLLFRQSLQRMAASHHQQHASKAGAFPVPWLVRSCHTVTRKHREPTSAAELGLYWGAAAVAMVGISYAAVPLYKIFCAATGYGGAVTGLETVEDKLKRRLEKPDPKVEQAAAEREITVWFNGDVAEDMPWEFTPTQECVRVRPGQSTLVFFTAKNKSEESVTGYSVYNVTPDKAAVYFNKIQCFCFEMQRLRGKEEIDMPVFFYLDPEMATDWHCRNLNDITLSYMFHKVDDEDLEDVDDDAPTVLKLHGPGMPNLPMGAAGQPPIPSPPPSH